MLREGVALMQEKAKQQGRRPLPAWNAILQILQVGDPDRSRSSLLPVAKRFAKRRHDK
jgi:hypothetical protein